MTDPIGSVRRAPGPRRTRGRRVGDTAPLSGAEAASEASAPSAPDMPAVDPTPVISAQILGQTEAADPAPPANSARQASSAYLKVEWSGPADRRHRRGRLSRTEV